MKHYIRAGIYRYVLADLLGAILSWMLFFFFRKMFIEDYKLSDYHIFLNDKRFFLGIVIIPLGWVGLFWLFGFYTNIYRKSRISELGKTFLLTAFGVLILFFAVILDGHIPVSGPSN